jgi:hypothetical protein
VAWADADQRLYTLHLDGIPAGRHGRLSARYGVAVAVDDLFGAQDEAFSILSGVPEAIDSSRRPGTG